MENCQGSVVRPEPRRRLRGHPRCHSLAGIRRIKEPSMEVWTALIGGIIIGWLIRMGDRLAILAARLDSLYAAEAKLRMRLPSRKQRRLQY